MAGVSTVITAAEAGDDETGGSTIWPGSTDSCDESGVGGTRVRIGGRTGEAGVSSGSSMVFKCGAVLPVVRASMLVSVAVGKSHSEEDNLGGGGALNTMGSVSSTMGTLCKTSGNS